jgi:hypothetical protein
VICFKPAQQNVIQLSKQKEKSMPGFMTYINMPLKAWPGTALKFLPEWMENPQGKISTEVMFLIRKKRPKSVRMNMDDMMDIIPNLTYGFIPSDQGADLDEFPDELTGVRDDDI